MDDSPNVFDPAAAEAASADGQPSAAELEAAGQASMFGGTVGVAPPTTPSVAPAQPYRVLARKYRPQTFSQLIGQEPMVRTLANAIRRGRLAAGLPAAGG